VDKGNPKVWAEVIYTRGAYRNVLFVEDGRGGGGLLVYL
jgi:hypothetical protein